MATSSTTLTMAGQLVPDEVWAAIARLLPPKPPHPKGGRPWIEDRAVLGGIIYVPRAGVPWRLLPAKELGCGSGVSCWRRLRDWQHAGVWEALHHWLLDWLGDDGQVDWSRASIDSVSVRARRGGTDRRESGRPGQGWLQVPPGDRRYRHSLGGRVVGRHTHDSRLLEAMVDAVPAVIGPRGRPGRRASDRPSSMATKATTTQPAGSCYGVEASPRGSPGVGWSPPRGWVATAGRSSGRWLGCWPTAG